MSENTFISKVKTVLSVIKSKIAIANANLKKRPVANVIVKGLLGIFLTIFGGIFLLIMAARIGVFGGMPSNSELRSISNPEGTELIADDGKL
jgi:hypothetical protein